MDKLKEVLKCLKNTVSDEIHLVKKLKGEKLEKICSDFCFDKDIRIYYTAYNLIFISQKDLDQVSPYLKSEDLVIAEKQSATVTGHVMSSFCVRVVNLHLRHMMIGLRVQSCI